VSAALVTDRRTRWRRPALALALGAALAAPRARGDGLADEYDVKAAMLLNVVKFVEWPSAAAGDLRVCVLGAPRFARALAATARRAGAGARAVAVSEPRSADGGRCDVAVIGRDGDAAVEELAGELAEAGVLTVADAEGWAARGVQVNFYVEGDRVRLEVNLAAVRRARLRVSSKLLHLARVVGGTP
jgi:YfiR/HmsC-like